MICQGGIKPRATTARRNLGENSAECPGNFTASATIETLAKSLRTKTAPPSCGTPPFGREATCPRRPRLPWSSKQVEWSHSGAKGDPCSEISLTGWSSPPNQRPAASHKTTAWPAGRHHRRTMAAWPARPHTSCLTNSLYILLAIYQFLSNRCLTATSFPARLVRLQSACGPARRLGPVRWLANFLSCWVRGCTGFTSSWTATSKTAVGLLLSAPLNFQAKSAEQAFLTDMVQGVQCLPNFKYSH